MHLYQQRGVEILPESVDLSARESTFDTPFFNIHMARWFLIP